MTPARKPRRRIALLSNEVGSLYQAHMWDYFVDATAHHDCASVGVFGRTWGSPVDNESVANEAYRFLHAMGVHATVVPGALLSTHQPIDGLQEAAGLSDSRSIYIGARTHTGQRLVRVDPEPAIRAGLHHLYQMHGCSRIGCVTGHASNPETGDRVVVYRKVLRELGLPWELSYEEPGDFNTEEGGIAACTLLNRHPDLQAIFFLSDNMAIGAYQALQEKGLEAGDMPAFLGFDDIEAAGICERPLTTIRQPTREMVWRAVERLQRRERSGTPEVDSLPSELVIRQSCGCDHPAAASAPHHSLLLAPSLDSLFQSRRVRRSAQALFADMSPSTWDQRLRTALERMDIPWAGVLEWKSDSPLPPGELSGQTFHRWVEFRMGEEQPDVAENVPASTLCQILDQHREPVLVFPLVCENRFLGLCLMQHVPGLELSYDPFILQVAASLRGSWLLEAQKQAEQKLLRLNRRLQNLSHRDELTGILNRRGFYMFAEQALRDLFRSREDILAALIFIDMDGLKGINDNLGHAEGDLAIRNVAIALRDTLRKSDILARMGGDEFVVLVRIKKPSEADALMQRALTFLRSLPMTGSRSLSFSYGVHCLRSTQPTTLNDLLALADTLLYEAKQKRGQITGR